MKNVLALFFLFLMLCQHHAFGQNGVDNYKYVSVPDRFDFLKSADQYQLNALTKFLLKKNGFSVLDVSSDYPKELLKNRCLLLDVNVIKLKGFLNTKLEVQFTNCQNEIVFRSDIGVSKIKDFKKGYHEALRKAFVSIAELNYSYKAAASSIQLEQTPEVAAVEVAPPPAPSKAMKELLPPPPPPVSKQDLSQVKIRPSDFGFTVIHEPSGKVLHTLHATLYEGVFIIDNLPGIAYKRGNRWVREFVVNQKIVIQPLLN